MRYIEDDYKNMNREEEEQEEDGEWDLVRELEGKQKEIEKDKWVKGLGIEGKKVKGKKRREEKWKKISKS